MSVLRLGSTGPDVDELQRLLNIQAEFGPVTERAVKAFQLASGLVPDGIVGPKTMAALKGLDVPAVQAPDDKRARAAIIARSWIDRSDAETVWAAVKTRKPYPTHWCWAFVLMCWREAQIVGWDFSKGVFWLSSRLPTTLHPLVADCAYFDKHQHHQIIVSVDEKARTFDAVNGNGEGGLVTLSENVPFSAATVFYSIAREL